MSFRDVYDTLKSVFSSSTRSWERKAQAVALLEDPEGYREVVADGGFTGDVNGYLEEDPDGSGLEEEPESRERY